MATHVIYRILIFVAGGTETSFFSFFQILFVVINVNAGFSHVLKYFGLTEDDAPTIRLIDTGTLKKYALDGKGLTAEHLHAFCQGVLDGTVEVSDGIWQVLQP